MRRRIVCIPRCSDLDPEGGWGVDMDAANWVQNFFAAGAKIDGLWSMYVVVQLGILWFVFLVHRPLLIIERLLALCGYGFFLFANGQSLIHGYKLSEAMRYDLVNHFKDGFTNMPDMFKVLTSLDYSDRGDMIFWTHGVAWMAAAGILLFRNKMVRYYAQQYPEHANGGVKADAA